MTYRKKNLATRLISTMTCVGVLLSGTFLVVPNAQAANPVFNDDPQDKETLRLLNFTQGETNWHDPISAVAGDRVNFDVYYHNTVEGTTALNTKIRIDFPETITNQIVTSGYITADNADEVIDTGTINLGSDQELVFYEGARWYPDQAGPGEFQEIGVTLTETSIEANIGDIEGGWSHQGHLVFAAWISSPPVADAGPDQTIDESTTTTLDGSGSADDKAIKTYSWSCTGGELDDSSLANPTFTAPAVDEDTDFICVLTVTDEDGYADNDEMTVTVVNLESPPFASAGGPYTVNELESITLNGSAFDVDGTIVSYSWDCEGGSLNDASLEDPTYTAFEVDEDTEYTCTLTVTDNDGLQNSCSICSNPTAHYPSGSALLSAYDANSNGVIGYGEMIKATEEDYKSGVIAYSEAVIVLMAYLVNSIDNLCDYQSTATITVIDANAPVITVNPQEVTIEVGVTYTDVEAMAGVSAYDQEDGDITASVQMVNPVDPDTRGTYTIDYSVTDSDSNTATAQRMVHVVGPPEITVNPAEITIQADELPYTDEQAMVGVTAWDEEDEDITSEVVVTNPLSGGSVAIGDYTVQYDVEDSDGMTDTGFRTVHVVQNDPPAITVNPATQTICQGTSYGNTAARNGVAAWDQEDGDITNDIVVTNNVNPNVLGIYTVDYYVEDSVGLSDQAQRTVIVALCNDLPSIIVDPQELDIEQGSVPAYTNSDALQGVIAVDLTDGDLTSQVQVASNSVDINTIGIYTVLYSVTDSDSNTAYATRIVNVVCDVENPPIITVNPAEVTIAMGSAYNDDDAMVGVTASDAEDGDLTEDILVTNNVNPNILGTYIVLYSVTDSDGYMGTGIRFVHVTDNHPPVITVNPATQTICQGTSYGNTAARNGVAAFDQEDGNLTSQIQVTNNVNPNVLGIYTVDYYVEDSVGLSDTDERTVIVALCNDLPSIIVNPQVENLSAGAPAYTDQRALQGVTAVDLTDGDLTSQVQVIFNNVDTSVAGQYYVLYSVTDSDSNTAYNERLVKVGNISSPVITIVPPVHNISVGDTYGTDEAMDGVTAWDVEDGDITGDIQIAFNNVNTSAEGTYYVVYSVTDSDSNVVQNFRTVIVGNGTLTPPVITVVPQSENIAQGSVYGNTEARTGVTATDAEDGDITGDIQVTNNVNPNVLGIYTVDYSVTDSDGMSDTAQRTVIVALGSDLPYIIVDPQVIDFPVGSPAYANSEALQGVTAVDLTDGDLTSQVQILSNPVDTNVVGTYVVAYSVTDSDGNVAQNYRIVDITGTHTGELPAITVDPAEETISIGDAYGDDEARAGVDASDAEDGDLTGSILVTNNVNSSQLGTYVVVYSVTDSDGNTVMAARLVNVRTGDGPVITVANPDISIVYGTPYSDNDALSGVTAWDNQDGDLTALIAVTNNPVNSSQPGVYTVTFSVTDSDSNVGYGQRIVRVLPNTIENDPPVITVDPLAQTINAGTVYGNTEAKAGVTAWDDLDGDLTSQIQVANHVNTNFNGVYTVDYSVADSFGETATAQRTVTVTGGPNPTDNNAPVITVDPLEVSIAVGAAYGKTEAMNGVTATDAEDGDLTDQIQVVNNVNSATDGTYTVQYSVTDSLGASVTAARIVTVGSGGPGPGPGGNRAPVLTVTPLTVSIALGDAYGNTEAMDGVYAYDIEDGDITDQVQVTNGVNSNVNGTYAVQYSVTDSLGSSAEATRTVIVGTGSGGGGGGGEDEASILGVSFLARNLTDDQIDWTGSLSVDPAEEVEFKIEITANEAANNSRVKVVLSDKISLSGNLEIDGVFSSEDISEGIDLGDIDLGRTITITFDAMVASGDSFDYGLTELVNTAIIESDQASEEANAVINVNRSEVAGEETEQGFQFSICCIYGGLGILLLLLLLLAICMLVSREEDTCVIKKWCYKLKTLLGR